MFNRFINFFIKDSKAPSFREDAGILSGITGIILNAFLFALKLTVGSIMGSVAVISDGFNNLSDMGSTAVTLVGIKLSSKRPDRDHPFGHGRFEYISALIVSFIIMSVGLELLRTSFDKIFSPDPVKATNWLLIGLLFISIPVKLFMMGLNMNLGRRCDSEPLLAAAVDSRNDCIATGAVILSATVDSLNILPVSIDGYAGAAVSLFILWSGFGVAKDTVALILGKAPDPETVKKIRSILLETPEIQGLHDLIVHDYGPGRQFVTVHAEVSDKCDLVAIHEIIDSTEKRVFRETGCETTIHMDPVCDDSPELEAIKNRISTSFSELKINGTFHDLRMTNGKENINVIFDAVFPADLSPEKTRLAADKIAADIKSLDSRYNAVIQIDRDFT